MQPAVPQLASRNASARAGIGRGPCLPGREAPPLLLCTTPRCRRRPPRLRLLRAAAQQRPGRLALKQRRRRQSRRQQRRRRRGRGAGGGSGGAACLVLPAVDLLRKAAQARHLPAAAVARGAGRCLLLGGILLGDPRVGEELRSGEALRGVALQRLQPSACAQVGRVHVSEARRLTRPCAAGGQQARRGSGDKARWGAGCGAQHARPRGVSAGHCRWCVGGWVRGGWVAGSPAQASL